MCANNTQPAVTLVQDLPARAMTARTLPISSQSSQLHALTLLRLVVLSEWNQNVLLRSLPVASLISGHARRTKRRQFLTTLVNWARSGKVYTTPTDEASQMSQLKVINSFLQYAIYLKLTLRKVKDSRLSISFVCHLLEEPALQRLSSLQSLDF